METKFIINATFPFRYLNDKGIAKLSKLCAQLKVNVDGSISSFSFFNTKREAIEYIYSINDKLLESGFISNNEYIENKDIIDKTGYFFHHGKCIKICSQNEFDMVNELIFKKEDVVKIMKAIDMDLKILDVIEKIIKLYNEEYKKNFSIEEIFTSKDKKHDISLLRFSIYYILFNKYKIRKINLARLFKRNHSAIINGISKIEGWITYDKSLTAFIEKLKNSV